MVERTTVELVDDLDGSPARHTVTFAIDGVTYAIDLNDKNAKALRALFARYIAKAQKTKSAPSKDSRSAGGTGQGQQRDANKQVTEQIRNAARRSRELHEEASTSTAEPVGDAAPPECADVGLFVSPPAAAATNVDSPTAPVELPQFSAATGP